ncbi:MAG TPA: amidohydrolase family protein, partial [Vicinamibacterales bacterium]
LTTYVVVAIVAATLIAGLIAGAARDDNSGPVDLIIHHARVYDAGSPPRFADAIAIRGNKILRVGAEREIMRYRRPQTMVIDAGGAAVLPGFDDAHASFIAGGLARAEVHLFGATSIDDIRQRVVDWSSEHPDAEWITGGGWSDDMLAAPPSHAQLDAAVAEKPIALRSQDGRAFWVNAKALDAAGITRRTPDPPGGAIVRDRRGVPTGLVKDAAMALIERSLPAAEPGARARALTAAIGDAWRHGVTSVQDLGAASGDLALYDAARREGRLGVRVYAASHASTGSVASLDDLARRYPDDPLLKAGLATMSIDDPSGRPSAASLGSLVAALNAGGHQVAIQASDEEAVGLALDAYEAAARQSGTETAPRNRVDIVEAAAPDDVQRIQTLGLIASTLPLQNAPRATSPLHMFGSVQAHVAFGSDWPNLPLDPLGAIAAAVAQASDDSAPADPAKARLAIESAINAWTSGSAWASFDDQRKGTIKPGMLADLVVLTSDIFKNPSQTAGAAVAMTIFDGKVVYRAH